MTGAKRLNQAPMKLICQRREISYNSQYATLKKHQHSFEVQKRSRIECYTKCRMIITCAVAGVLHRATRAAGAATAAIRGSTWKTNSNALIVDLGVGPMTTNEDALISKCR